MADVVNREVRSRMMSGIRGKNTKPELILRKGLHAAGFRFRIHAPLPGKPDIVLPKWHAVIFVHGCFWHNHHCHLFKWPKSREKFWKAKIRGNASRDVANVARLLSEGWRVGIVWECAFKGRTRLNSKDAIERCTDWIKSTKKRFELEGGENAPRAFV
jgi:DNA mismatch endonuclease (patch repair protein)